MTLERRPQRKLREGIVVSDKMNKTRVVLVTWHSRHPLYEKVLRHQSRFYAHDETNHSRVGDRVAIAETRPLSRLKRWRVVRVLGKAKEVPRRSDFETLSNP